MIVGLVGHAVELEVGEAHARGLGAVREVEILGEADSVGRGLHAVIADLPAVRHGIQEVRRQRRLSARELHRHLPVRLHVDRIVENLADVVPGQLVNVPDLVRVHEAGVAHHVASVGQIDGQHRAAAVLDGRGSVVVEGVGRHPEIAARIELFHPAQELDVDRHQVLAASMLRAIFFHPHLSVPLDDARLDLSRLAVDQRLPVGLAVEDPLAHILDALGAERIGLARVAELREGSLMALQQRRRRPLRLERPVRHALVNRLEGMPGEVCRAFDPGTENHAGPQVPTDPLPTAATRSVSARLSPGAIGTRARCGSGRRTCMHRIFDPGLSLAHRRFLLRLPPCPVSIFSDSCPAVAPHPDLRPRRSRRGPGSGPCFEISSP